VAAAVRLALDEDAGRGDVTTASCVPPTTRGRAVLRAREDLVVCGLAVVCEVYRQLDPHVELEVCARDGTRLAADGPAARIHGPAASILTGERVALNFVQRLSGVATLTRRFVDALPVGSRTRIADTRKTTPGLRALERYAVRCGGGHNHREDLSSAVLIKDNHIAAAGGVRRAIECARATAPHTSRIECEVDTFEQLREALDAGVDIVLLDNFDDAATKQAAEMVSGRACVEASGGVHQSRVSALAQAGVDVISVGALTHSAPAADLGLDWE
jgi:nicotinate-nucleotide pyrophosphorylase (carboxylating)